MKNSELFMIVGQYFIGFLLSLMDMKPSEIEPKLFWIASLIASIFIWLRILIIAIAIIKKMTGFDHPPGPR